MERSLPAHPSLGGRVFAVLYRYDRNGAPKGFELNPGEGAIRVEARRPRQKVGGSTGDNVLSAVWPVALEFPMLDRPLRGPVRQACFRLMKHMTGHAAPTSTVLRNSLNLCIAAKNRRIAACCRPSSSLDMFSDWRCTKQIAELGRLVPRRREETPRVGRAPSSGCALRGHAGSPVTPMTAGDGTPREGRS